MSIEAMTWALTAPVGGSQKVVLLGLANHAHPDGTNAFPSAATLAEYAHCDRRTVMRTLKKLEAAGLIRRDGEGRNGTVNYTLPIAGGVRHFVTPGETPVSQEPSSKDVEEEDFVFQENVPPSAGVPSSQPTGADPATRVWTFYLEAMKKPELKLPADDRRTINEALRVFSEDECCAAIRGCAASAFHMGENPQGRKHNQLSKILRAKRPGGPYGGSGRTLRENVEFFISLAPNGGEALPSVDPDKVHRAKRTVLDAWTFQGNAEAQKRGTASVDWLARHGITTESDENGRPRFVRTDR